MNLENIERPNTKWVFVRFSTVEAKVVLDRQPLLGTGPLPTGCATLRGRPGPMKALDYFNDNVCLWRCIAVFRGARVDRSTQAARELLKRFYKLDYTPNDFPKTSIDELDKIERHFNQGKPLSDWFDIRVFKPKREEQEN